MAEERNQEALTAIEAALAGCPSAGFKARLRGELETTILMSTGASTLQAARGIRRGFTAVTPYVVAADVEGLIAFIKRAFDGEETGRSSHGDGRLHCEMRIGDSMLMLGAGTPPKLAGFHMFVDDTDAVYRRAIDAGGESLGAPEDRPYGERSGFVKDPAGNYWFIATRLGPSYFAEHPRTVTPHVYLQAQSGKGAPEFIEFLKAAFGANLEMRHDFPDGRVGHALVHLAGAAIEMGEGHEPSPTGPAAFYLYVEDCDALYNQAVAAGAKSMYEPMDMPYGDRSGGVEDAWGNIWSISTHLA